MDINEIGQLAGVAALLGGGGFALYKHLDTKISRLDEEVEDKMTDLIGRIDTLKSYTADHYVKQTELARVDSQMKSLRDELTTVGKQITDRIDTLILRFGEIRKP